MQHGQHLNPLITHSHPTDARAAYEKPKMFEAAPLRPNSILVLGSMDSIGQWVAYDLVEKGFSVRVCSLYK